MNKPASLRLALETALTELRANTARLLMFVEKGGIAARLGTLSFTYQFDLNCIITDFSGDIDTVMVTVLDWLNTNQPSLLQNPDKQQQGIRFEAEIISSSTLDLSLTLSLTERVSVQTTAEGTTTITHPPQPAYD